MDNEPVLMGYKYVKLELEGPSLHPNESVGEGNDVILTATEVGVANVAMDVMKVENKEEAEITSPSPVFVLPDSLVEETDWDVVTPEMDSSCHGEGVFADPQIEIDQVDVKLLGSISKASPAHSKHDAKRERLSRPGHNSTSHPADDLAKIWRLRPCYVKLQKLAKDGDVETEKDLEAARVKALMAERNKIRWYTRPPVNVCKFCVRSFANRSQKNLHLKKYHFWGFTQCPVRDCAYTAYQKSDLEKHRKRRNCPYLKERPIPLKKCEYCGTELSTPSNLRKHIRYGQCYVRERQLRSQREMEAVEGNKGQGDLEELKADSSPCKQEGLS